MMFEAFVVKRLHRLHLNSQTEKDEGQPPTAAAFVSVQLDPRGRFTQLYYWITHTIQRHIISLLPSRTKKTGPGPIMLKKNIHGVFGCSLFY